jgi:hypothetical protein
VFLEKNVLGDKKNLLRDLKKTCAGRKETIQGYKNVLRDKNTCSGIKKNLLDEKKHARG